MADLNSDLDSIYTPTLGTTVPTAWLTEINTNFTAFEYSTFTPNWTASTTNPTLGSGTLTMKYFRLGQVGFWQLRAQFGAGFANGAGTYFWSLPSGWSTVDGAYQGAGNGRAFDDSLSASHAILFGLTSNTLFARLTSDSSLVSDTNPFTFAVNDFVAGSGMVLLN